MQRHKKLSARILSMALTVAMIATMMPSTVFAAESDVPLGASSLGASAIGTIRSFEKLEDRFEPSTGEGASKDVYALNVELNTPFEDLNLPDELTAMVARTTTVSAPAEDEPVVDSGKPSEPAEDEVIPDEDKVVDEDTTTDDTVSGNQPASPSDAEENPEIPDEDVPLAPEPEDEETVVTTTEQEIISVTWQSDKEYKSDENGRFIYTSVLPEGYILADGVKLPQIYVLVGEQEQSICADTAESNALLDRLLALTAEQQVMIDEGGADVTSTDRFKALAVEIDELYAHVDVCGICAAQMAEGGAYYEKFYPAQTMEVGNVVAKIGENTYTSLQDAFTAVADGDSIIIQQAITQNTSISKIISDSVVDFTLDLNGFDVTITANSVAPYHAINLQGKNANERSSMTITDLSGNSTLGKLTVSGALGTKTGEGSGIQGNNFNIIISKIEVEATGTILDTGAINGNISINEGAIVSAKGRIGMMGTKLIIDGATVTAEGIDNNKSNTAGITFTDVKIIDSDVTAIATGSAKILSIGIQASGSLEIIKSTVNITATSPKASTGINLMGTNNSITNSTVNINSGSNGVAMTKGPVLDVTTGQNLGAWYSDKVTYAPLNGDTAYTVTFDAGENGTVILSGTTGKRVQTLNGVKSGTTFAAPPKDPTNTDSTKSFAGWYKDSNFNTAWNFATDTVTKDMTLYAKWGAYSVTYNANGGSGSMTDSKNPYVENATVTVLPNGFTPPANKVFKSWNTLADGNGTSYAANDTFTIAANATLYAQWKDTPKITITAQPTATTVTYGQITETMSVSASATDALPISYQWYSNTTSSTTGGTEVSGATTATLSIPTSLNAGSYYYYCVLKAADCTDVTTNIATVTVNKATATSAMTTVATSVSKDGKTGATVTLPTNPTGASYGTPTAGGTITMTTMSITGDTLTYTAPASTAGQTGTITIPVTGATNYNNYSIAVTVTSTDKTPVTVTGLTAATGLTYSGNTQNGYTGTLSVEGNKVPVSELVYTYTSTDSGTYNSSTAPTNAGAYKLTIKIADSNASYTGAHADINFTIGKKAVTVTADNKSIVIGAAKPTYTATADGLVSGQSISGVTFTDTATDTNTKGTFDIVPSGGTISGGNDNYSITYVKGTLTITVATQVIDTAIVNANAAKSGITINEGPASSVTNGTKFVTAAEMKALTDAIAAAEAAKSTANTAAEAQAAATALDNAVATFNAAIKIGTYTSSSGGGGSSSGGSSTTPPTKTEPVSGTSNTTATVDKNGNATTTVTDKNIADAVQAAKDAASKKGVNAGEVTAVINVTAPANSNPNTVTVNLPKTVQQQVISNKIDNVAIVIDKPDISIGMNLATITEMNKQANADIALSATRTDATTLSAEAKNAIGNRPAFDLKATYASGAKSITSFGSGSVSVAIPYTLQKGEVAGGLYAVYIDSNGKANYITGSSYDANTKMLRFATNHFSVYGIGYKAPVGFTDIAGHWAKADIEFVANRGLMSGTSNTTFAPNGSMTRGMFVTALGRLAGVDTNSYKTGKFTDVKADAYYAPYVNWAAEKGITNGTTATTFSPDSTVTRQEMAVFMSNYAKAMGYKVPETRAAVTFADNGSIGSWAAAAVKQMQMAGVLNGKNGNKFDPTGTATRAEVAAVLHRYVELVIDRTTAQGLDTNDSGSAMMYENGKAVKSASRTVGSSTYNFNANGEAALLPADNKKTGTYTVQKGDSFWLIAKKVGCTMAELEQLNGKSRNDFIYAGQTLKVPHK